MFKLPHLFLLSVLLVLSPAAHALEFISVSSAHATLYDAPSAKGKKLFVVNRYMPFELVVNLDLWVKVRDRTGGLYWIEKRDVSFKRYVFAVSPLIDVRKQPEFTAPRAYQVRQQVALELLESSGTGWLKVRHQDGDIGFVNHADVWGD
ncbi:MAG: SH3 domain-containing protein [Gallionella sp.]